MTDEELIARIDHWVEQEVFCLTASDVLPIRDRIEALQDRIKRLESVGRAYREVTHHLKPCPETSAAFDAALGNKS